MTSGGTRRPGDPTRVLIVLELGLAIAALGGAFVLVVHGTSLGRAGDDVPFQSTVFAGIALAAVNGVLPLAIVAATLRRRWWARLGHVLVGAALISWIAVQVALMGWTSWLQPALLAYGLAISAVALHAVRIGQRPHGRLVRRSSRAARA